MKADERSLEESLQAQQSRMQAEWRRRADRLSQRLVPSGDGQSGSPVLVVGIGTERYGIDLPNVAEVLAPIEVTPVPGVAPVFAGVINAHGEIRPVIDLRRLLGMAAVQTGQLTRVVLLRKEGRGLGLRVDSVEQIRRIGPAEQSLTPARGDTEASKYGASKYGTSKYVMGSTKDLLMLLSIDALFAELNTAFTI